MGLFLCEALRDSEEDFTTGPVSRALGLLAVIVFRRGRWKLHEA